MTITTDQAIALAREVGALPCTPDYMHISEQQLTALCNAVRSKTLLEAAEKLNRMADEALKGKEAWAVKGAALALTAGVE